MSVDRVVAEARAMLERVLALEIVERSLVVGAQAFSALIPLLIVLASWGARDGGDLADGLIDRFGLKGDGAEAVRRAFTAPAQGDTVTALGVALVVLSALSFTRVLQRLFERTWDLPRRGMRASAWGLGWLTLFALYWAAFPIVHDDLHGLVRWTISLAATLVMWLATPYVLLARRVHWRTLLLQAALTAAGMTALSAGSAVWLPRAMNSSAAQFGSIGVAFALLSLLWAGGFVLVGAAALGSYPYTGARRRHGRGDGPGDDQSRAIAAAR